jgi:hypothetical protein
MDWFVFEVDVRPPNLLLTQFPNWPSVIGIGAKESVSVSE